ncbi:MAG: AAA family ATPase [Hyphomicrobium sp.]
MADVKFGVSLDRAPAMLRAIILETLAEVRGLRLIHMPAGGFAPDCQVVILVGEEAPETHLRGKVECVVNFDPESARGLLYRAGAVVRRIDQLPVKTLLDLITAEFERGRVASKASPWNLFGWFGQRSAPPDEEPTTAPSEPQLGSLAVHRPDAVTAELARLASRMTSAMAPSYGGDGPARELRELLEALKAAAEHGKPSLDPLDRIVGLFGLDADERDLLFLASVVEIEPLAARLVALMNDHLSRPRPTVGIVAQWGGNPRALVERLTGDGPLLRFGLVALEGEGPVSTQTVVPAPAVWPLIFDMARTPPFVIDGHAPDDVGEAQFAAPTDWKKQFGKSVETIRKADWGNILVAIIGEDDSGRGEIARAVAARLGPASLRVEGHQLADTAALGAVLREAALANATVILVDPHEAPVAQWKALTAGLRGPLIAIAAADQLGASALNSARALVRIDAPARDYRQRVRLWTAEAPAEWRQGDIAAIADRFDFGRRRIVAALSNAQAQTVTEGRKTLEPSDVMRACAVLRQTSFGGSAELLECLFEPDEIVLREDTRREIDLAIAWARHGSRLFGKDGPAGSLRAGSGLACLFTGPPGTGKTMAAQIVAREVDYALYRVDLSQVIDKYIGEGEKRISALFKEAGRSRVALFFDEADALFGKRTEVKDSHDRYANIAVNHLLQELEGFDGLSILATNFATNIDTAFMRRIRVRADFPAPNAQERQMIWERLLTAPTIEGSDINVARLAADYDLVGGEIRNAIYTAHLLAADDKTAKRLAMRHCLAGLAREIGKTGRVVDAAMLCQP